MGSNKLSYSDSGVDIDAGNTLVKKIIPLAKKTHSKEVLTGLGGFGALYNLSLGQYKNPVLVSGTDGVGTKLKLAIDLDKHDTIGIDLVAMCVNDLIVGGAKPLFFLDYFATAKLDVNKGEDIVKGIAEGCIVADCSLVGGETAEMPGMYQKGDYDLAGFSVGIVEKHKIINGDSLKCKDQIIAIASNGIHSNGYSLVRKILEINKISLDMPFSDGTLAETLLKPTRIYVKTILSLIEKINIKALCHITGGGITENLPRVMPNYLKAQIKYDSSDMPEIFQWLKNIGNIDDNELLKTFNCGVGMIAIVEQEDLEDAICCLNDLGEKAWHLGEIKDSDSVDPVVEYIQ